MVDSSLGVSRVGSGSSKVIWYAYVGGIPKRVNVVPCSRSEFSGGPSSSLMARHNDGGIPKPAKSLLRRGFLNPMLPIVLGPSKETSGMAPSPSAPGEFSRPEDLLGGGVAGLQATNLRPLFVLNSKPLQHYSCKSRDNKFLKKDDSLIAKLMSSFSAPPISSCEVNALPIVVYYLASEVDSEEEDYVCWDGDDRYFSLATLFN